MKLALCHEECICEQCFRGCQNQWFNTQTTFQLCSNSEAQFGVIERLHDLSKLMNFVAYEDKRYYSDYKAKEATKNPGRAGEHR